MAEGMTEDERGSVGSAAFDPALRPSDMTATASSTGHDGDPGTDDTDPDRRDLRAEIGKYVSLASFPATAAQLCSTAREGGADDTVMQRLEGLPAGETYPNARELWAALGLGDSGRF
jgi:hypothetical protein